MCVNSPQPNQCIEGSWGARLGGLSLSSRVKRQTHKKASICSQPQNLGLLLLLLLLLLPPNTNLLTRPHPTTLMCNALSSKFHYHIGGVGFVRSCYALFQTCFSPYLPIFCKVSFSISLSLSLFLCGKKWLTLPFLPIPLILTTL